MGPKVEAVKVACKGEMRLYGTDLFTKVTVPRSYLIFDSQLNISPISKLIGMPLHTTKYPANTASD